MCSPAYKGHNGLTLFLPSFDLVSTVFKSGFLMIKKKNSNMKQELRSLKELTKHFTTRTDDSHATPVIPYCYTILLKR